MTTKSEEAYLDACKGGDPDALTEYSAYLKRNGEEFKAIHAMYVSMINRLNTNYEIVPE